MIRRLKKKPDMDVAVAEVGGVGYKPGGDYDEFVGLATTLGVVSALLLSLQIGLYASAQTSDLVDGDIRAGIMFNRGEFNAFVLKHLESKSFDFTPVTFAAYGDTASKTLNVRTVLEDKDSSDNDRVAVYHIVKDQLDSNHIQAAFQVHDFPRQSDEFSLVCLAGSILFTLATMISVVVYIGLVVSDAKEMSDEHPDVLERMQKATMPMVVVGYVGVLGGAWCFFVSAQIFAGFVFPNSTLLWMWFQGLAAGLLPLCIVCVLITAISVAWSLALSRRYRVQPGAVPQSSDSPERKYRSRSDSDSESR
eukprot:GFYU01006920.1.p1 GENE.GFYU01006920.1~~GFYU01006920.1.p1  ORF type:complete len:307 (+),score=52.64 GFYU01006920.1:145-1065(+)